MKEIFDKSSYQCSKIITRNYSTSFSLGINLFSPKIKPAIYAIYGFVRCADEIVDTFEGYPQATLLSEFEEEYKKAVERKISMNPVINSFQEIVNQYQLQEEVNDFMVSMKMDLNKDNYKTTQDYENYIHGSADVIGLMCLKIFANGDEEKYKDLKPYAVSLGSAFQKVNFLRDIKDDFESLGRSYFPNMNGYELNERAKKEIIEDIEKDFKSAYEGIVKLPTSSKLGVYLAYRYYLLLLKKLKTKNSKEILSERTRVSNLFKLIILFKSYTRHKLNMI